MGLFFPLTKERSIALLTAFSGCPPGIGHSITDNWEELGASGGHTEKEMHRAAQEARRGIDGQGSNLKTGLHEARPPARRELKAPKGLLDLSTLETRKAMADIDSLDDDPLSNPAFAYSEEEKTWIKFYISLARRTVISKLFALLDRAEQTSIPRNRAIKLLHEYARKTKLREDFILEHEGEERRYLEEVSQVLRLGNFSARSIVEQALPYLRKEDCSEEDLRIRRQTFLQKLESDRELRRGYVEAPVSEEELDEIIFRNASYAQLRFADCHTKLAVMLDRRGHQGKLESLNAIGPVLQRCTRTFDPDQGIRFGGYLGQALKMQGRTDRQNNIRAIEDWEYENGLEDPKGSRRDHLPPRFLDWASKILNRGEYSILASRYSSPEELFTEAGSSEPQDVLEGEELEIQRVVNKLRLRAQHASKEFVRRFDRAPSSVGELIEFDLEELEQVGNTSGLKLRSALKKTVEDLEALGLKAEEVLAESNWDCVRIYIDGSLNLRRSAVKVGLNSHQAIHQKLKGSLRKLGRVLEAINPGEKDFEDLDINNQALKFSEARIIVKGLVGRIPKEALLRELSLFEIEFAGLVLDEHPEKNLETVSRRISSTLKYPYHKTLKGLKPLIAQLYKLRKDLKEGRVSRNVSKKINYGGKNEKDPASRRAFIKHLLQFSPEGNLSREELGLLKLAAGLIAEGDKPLSNRQLSRTLGISQHSAKKNLTRALSKLKTSANRNASPEEQANSLRIGLDRAA